MTERPEGPDEELREAESLTPIQQAAKLGLTDGDLAHLRWCDPWFMPCGRCGKVPVNPPPCAPLLTAERRLREELESAVAELQPAPRSPEGPTGKCPRCRYGAHEVPCDRCGGSPEGPDEELREALIAAVREVLDKDWRVEARYPQSVAGDAAPAGAVESPAGAAPLVITVHGEPAPQGSKRHVGGGRMIESSAKVKPWREAVKHAALPFVAPSTSAGLHATPLSGPMCVEATFTVRKPASAPKRRTTWPQRKPDLDKLLRSTFDALSDAGVWVDDAQVVEVCARKVYPQEGVDALDHPGAVIRLWQVTA